MFFDSLTDSLANIGWPEKNKYKNTVSVTLDIRGSRLLFCSEEGEDTGTLQQYEKKFKAKPYTDNFYAELTDIARDYAGVNPLIAESGITVVLPNELIAMDTVSLPAMNRRRTEEAMDAVLASQHKNREGLKINYSRALQNNQISVFSVAAMRADIHKAVTDALTQGGLLVHHVTFYSNARTAATIKTLPKKQPRKLPKFMLRPQPRTDEEYGYENFRIFIKWALNLIRSNEKLISLGRPEAVLVRMPRELDYLYERTNAEVEENGIEFRPVQWNGARQEIVRSPEQYGGMYAFLHEKNGVF